ncbi:MAG: hypothetical protein ACRDLP_10585, partial [Solirubrobacteraceae bacterium]
PGMTGDELDRAYLLLSQSISRVSPDEHERFLARLVLLLLASHADLEAALTAIADAVPGAQR